jgi:SHAQKYF class myb-like DNA-binding protein
MIFSDDESQFSGEEQLSPISSDESPHVFGSGRSSPIPESAMSPVSPPQQQCICKQKSIKSCDAPPSRCILHGDKKERSNKKRFVWSSELHTHFVRAFETLGSAATPKKVMCRMKLNGADMEGLTRIKVASHFQVRLTISTTRTQILFE